MWGSCKRRRGTQPSQRKNVKLEQLTIKQNCNRYKRIEFWTKGTQKMSGIYNAICPARHLQNSSQHVRAYAAGDGAICSKPKKKLSHIKGTAPIL